MKGASVASARLICSNGFVSKSKSTFRSTGINSGSLQQFTSRTFSGGQIQLGGRSANLASSSPPFTDREGFLSLLPRLIDEVCQDPSIADLHPHISEHMEAAIKYNIV